MINEMLRKKDVRLVLVCLTFVVMLGAISACTNKTSSTQDVAKEDAKVKKSVVVYTSVDQVYSEPILKQFEKELDIFGLIRKYTMTPDDYLTMIKAVMEAELIALRQTDAIAYNEIIDAANNKNFMLLDSLLRNLMDTAFKNRNIPRMFEGKVPVAILPEDLEFKF